MEVVETVMFLLTCGATRGVRDRFGGIWEGNENLENLGWVACLVLDVSRYGGCLDLKVVLLGCLRIARSVLLAYLLLGHWGAVP